MFEVVSKAYFLTANERVFFSLENCLILIELFFVASKKIKVPWEPSRSVVP